MLNEVTVICRSSKWSTNFADAGHTFCEIRHARTRKWILRRCYATDWIL